MSKVGLSSVPCALCWANIVKGIIHKINDNYVCDKCAGKLRDDEGIEYDGYMMGPNP
jgi:hypothetical protein